MFVIVSFPMHYIRDNIMPANGISRVDHRQQHQCGVG